MTGGRSQVVTGKLQRNQAWAHGRTGGLGYLTLYCLSPEDPPVCWRATVRMERSCVAALESQAWSPQMTYCWSGDLIHPN